MVEHTGVVTLDLGLTSYAEYLGTNRLDARDARDVRVRDGVRNFGDPGAHFANALGCETLLITSDEHVVLLLRSSAVATHSGNYNGPSGHPEPTNVGITPDTWRHSGAGEALSKAACSELFDSVVQEVVDESNVPRASLSEPRLLGAMTDSAGKPDILFVTRTDLDCGAVREAYARGGKESWESEGLTLINVADIGSIRMPLAATTRAAIECFQRARACKA